MDITKKIFTTKYNNSCVGYATKNTPILRAVLVTINMLVNLNFYLDLTCTDCRIVLFYLLVAIFSSLKRGAFPDQPATSIFKTLKANTGKMPILSTL